MNLSKHLTTLPMDNANNNIMNDNGNNNNNNATTSSGGTTSRARWYVFPHYCLTFFLLNLHQSMYRGGPSNDESNDPTLRHTLHLLLQAKAWRI